MDIPVAEVAIKGKPAGREARYLKRIKPEVTQHNMDELRIKIKEALILAGKGLIDIDFGDGFNGPYARISLDENILFRTVTEQEGVYEKVQEYTQSLG